MNSYRYRKDGPQHTLACLPEQASPACPTGPSPLQCASTHEDLDLPTAATSLRAIIFDLNGVIADDEPPHALGFRQTLEEFGVSLNRDDPYGTYLGMDERTGAPVALAPTYPADQLPAQSFPICEESRLTQSRDAS